jgi:hypothetical protein
MVAKVLARVKVQLEALAKPTDLDKLCDATVHAVGNNAATTPAMMRAPISGTLQCTKQGVLDAQVHHTQQLGSQQQFTTDKPHSAFLAHVTAELGGSLRHRCGAERDRGK